ncbi:M15 family metallopeptidase [Microbacteriaceae bacterium K1510]|jgi:zinc D-Ala-D-Ala carboxypeptidase|nr:M15 family metallopeptidase [Microbacteriaceae bacterium K1510]
MRWVAAARIAAHNGLMADAPRISALRWTVTIGLVAIVVASACAFAVLPRLVAPRHVAAAPAVAAALPVPALTSTPNPAPQPCDDPAVTAALAARDDEAVITAVGGGAAFRDAVVSGDAPCITLADANHVWVVVDKARPLEPLSFAPAALAKVGVRLVNGAGQLQPPAAAALTTMSDAAAAAGVGSLGVVSGYRSYQTQVSTYASNVANGGKAAADATSAHPGYSEHQTGFATDVVSCTSAGCGTMDGFGTSAAGKWVAENGWRYGFIVRYEPGQTAVSGYDSEPWHLRYIGPQLAAAYHDGGFHTLEAFFGLPAAPNYLG